MKLTGAITALVTPFKNGAIDEESLARLVEAQLKAGISGFVVHGTTGESPTLSLEEKQRVFAFIKARVPKGFPLIVGTGTNSTADSVALTKSAQAWGADAALVVVPYYNKPPQRGLFAHFAKIAAEGGLPVILYNVPSRTITALTLETIVRLSHVPGIVGIKEASGDLEFARSIRREAKAGFNLLSGDDASYEGFLAAGGDGIISVASHILPEAFVGGRISRHLPVINGLYVEANPIPVKKALQLMSILSSAELRLPLVEMDETLVPALRAQMKQAEILP